MTEAQDKQERDKQTEAIRKWGPRLARALAVFAVVVGIYGVIVLKHLDRNTKTQATLISTLEHRQYLNCHRINIERRTANEQNYADYKFFVLTEKLVKGAIATGAPPDEAQRITRGIFLDGFKENIATKAFIPLSYCAVPIEATGPQKLAAERALYEPPNPITFESVKGKPPPSAFSIEPGQ